MVHWQFFFPFQCKTRDPIRSASTHDSKPSTSSTIAFVTLELRRNILLQDLSPVNHCDCAAPIRSPRSWANGFFKNRGSSCKQSLSLLPQLPRGQFAENHFKALFDEKERLLCRLVLLCLMPDYLLVNGRGGGGEGGSSILMHLRCEWIKNKLSSSHGHCFLVSIKMSKKCIFQAKIFGDRRSLSSRHLVSI